MSDDQCENDEDGVSLMAGITINAVPPKPIWKWDFLGDSNTIVISTYCHVPWWKRFTTRLLFGSKWEKF